MASKKESIEFLELGLAELKQLHDAISSSYDSIKAKALALLAGEVAIVTFLFADSSGTKVSPSNYTISTAIFYIMGIVMLSLSFLCFLYVVSIISWRQPPESKIIKNARDWFNDDKEKLLIYLHSEYNEAITHCNSLLSTKAKRYTQGIYLLVFGILILVLLKYGKGVINL